MISYLSGNIIEKRDHLLVVDVGGVGYEVIGSPSLMATLGDVGAPCKMFVFSHYKTDGVSLYGFLTSEEKQLFLQLIKVDTVGPKSALNILQAAPWAELVDLIDNGEAAALAKLPKISKKVADHLVVKLKGKLTELRLMVQSSDIKRVSVPRGRRDEVQSVLTNLGYRTGDVSKILESLDEDVWNLDTEDVIRKALSQMVGSL